MKKLNKFFAVLVALAMMATLCVSMAFAEQTSALEEALEDARIKKTFTIPEGVIDPDILATFTFTGDASKSSGLKENEAVPSLSAPTVNYDGDAQQTTESKTWSGYATLPTTTFPHAGVYAYNVEESTAVVSNTTDTNYEVEKGGETYTVKYYVVTDENGDPYVKYITVEGEGKVDSFIDNDENDEWSNGDDSNFAFTNVYKVTNGDDTQDPEGPVDLDEVALKVTKEVTGDTDESERAFPFTITLTAAAGQSVDGLKAYVYDADGEAVTDGDPAEQIVYTVPANGVLNFTLKDGQALAFLTLPAGTRYAVSETLNNATDYNAYIPSYEVTSEGSAATATFEGAASAGQTLATAGEANVGTYLLAANKNDAAAYENEYDADIDTPTGILISNLPYIALALVAIGGLVAYVVIRRRNADEV